MAKLNIQSFSVEPANTVIPQTIILKISYFSAIKYFGLM